MYREMPDHYRQTLIQELQYQHAAPTIKSDILIVVRNQYDHVRRCLRSVQETTNSNLFLWDNGSEKLTAHLLRDCNPEVLARSEINLGFIRPNNYLASLTSAPYIILLNSDTIVNHGWVEAMIGLLVARPEVGVVGYQGGILDDNFIGINNAWGEDIDYVCGWCMCIKREIYEHLGLFDNKLKFAYGEDSDFCLRVKAIGYKIYALHLEYVRHIGAITINDVKNEIDTTISFKDNHLYLKNKWGKNDKKKSNLRIL